MSDFWLLDSKNEIVGVKALKMSKDSQILVTNFGTWSFFHSFLTIHRSLIVLKNLASVPCPQIRRTMGMSMCDLYGEEK